MTRRCGGRREEDESPEQAAAGVPSSSSSSSTADRGGETGARRTDTEATGTGCRPDTAPRTLTIVNKRGLHARASAKFVQTAERFDAEVSVFRDGMSVGGQSIMGLMMLAASQGTTIDVSATGPDAAKALAAIEILVADRFGEEA